MGMLDREDYRDYQQPVPALFADQNIAPPDRSLMLGAPSSDSSGIGLAAPETQAPAPVTQGVPDMNIPRAPTRNDLRQQAIDQMTPGQKFASALGEFGAAVTGKDSPLDKKLKQQREDRLLQAQEFKVHVSALEDGIKMSENFSGKARDDFIKSYSQRLDGIDKGLGETFRAMGQQPDASKFIMENAEDIPELAMALQVDPSGRSARKLVQSDKFMEHVLKARDTKQLPMILKKGATFKDNWAAVAPPEMVKKFNADGELSANEIMQANAWIRANKPELAAMTFGDDELKTIGRLGDQVWTPLGVLPAKSDVDIREAAAKDRAKDKDQWSEPYMLNGALVQKNDKNDEIRTAVARPPVNNNTTVFAKENKKFEQEDKLRNDYTANPNVKASSEMNTAFKMIETAYKNPTPANDLAMATKYMKILDPTSVVRESEFALAVNATGLMDKVMNYSQSILAGKKLNPAQRKDFHDSAKAINDTFQEGRAAVDAQYKEMAESYKLDPKNVIPSLRWKKNDDLPTVKTDADFAKLPSGAEFIAPDGSKRKKP